MMPRRLSQEITGAIHAALAAGQSVDAIVERLGVSRKTVYKARHRGGYARPPRKHRNTPLHYRDESLAYERCPQCGGMVTMPCQLCATRRFKKSLGQARVGCIFPNPREAIG
jgi:hypothetical protein